MVSPLHKKRAVKHVVEKGMCSLRRACRYLGLSRSQYYREPKAAQEGEESLLKRLIELSLLFPRYGYRPVTHLLQREGLVINHKKVQRIRRKEGLGVKPAKPKSKRRGKSTAAPASAGKVNAVWCWDFIFDTTEDGRRLKIFSLVDEYSRFCLRLKDYLPVPMCPLFQDFGAAMATGPTFGGAVGSVGFTASGISTGLKSIK
jgi:putative transposase